MFRTPARIGTTMNFPVATGYVRIANPQIRPRFREEDGTDRLPDIPLENRLPEDGAGGDASLRFSPEAVDAELFPFEKADRTAIMREEAIQKSFQKRHDFIDTRSGCERLERLTQYIGIPSRLALRGQRPLEFLREQQRNLVRILFPSIHGWYDAEKAGLFARGLQSAPGGKQGDMSRFPNPGGGSNESNRHPPTYVREPNPRREVGSP